MLNIKRYKNDATGWYNYYLEDGNNKLGIAYRENGDLYFFSELFEKGQEIEFYITKENRVIYNLFDELFYDIKKAQIFQIDEFQLQFIDSEEEKEQLYRQYDEWNQELKERDIYKKLFNNDTITWISDESVSFDIASSNSLRLTKEENQYKLKLTFNEKKYLSGIRINNSRSRYGPFNIFMKHFFIKLQEYDPEYHQIHMEEYLYTKNNIKQLVKK